MTLPTEPNGVFRVNLVQGSLGDPVSHGTGVSGPLNELGAAGSARDVYDLLILGAHFNQLKESVGDGNRPNHIGPELFHRSGVNCPR